jgi:hypothetical protein
VRSSSWGWAIGSGSYAAEGGGGGGREGGSSPDSKGRFETDPERGDAERGGRDGEQEDLTVVGVGLRSGSSGSARNGSSRGDGKEDKGGSRSSNQGGTSQMRIAKSPLITRCATPNGATVSSSSDDEGSSRGQSRVASEGVGAGSARTLERAGVTNVDSSDCLPAGAGSPMNQNEREGTRDLHISVGPADMPQPL